MPIINFDIAQVKLLVDHVRAAKQHSPTMDMLFDAKYYKNKIIKDKDGLTELQVKKKGGHFWPSSDHIDRSLVEPVLQLVGDQGVYLITNAQEKLSPSESGLIVYANGIHPEIDDDWYEAKRYTFGGDDGSVTIPLKWFDIAFAKKNARLFSINLDPNAIELVQ
jgi:hypothetical protein